MGEIYHPALETFAQYPSYQRTREMSIEDMLLENRIIFLAGPITERTAGVVIMRLLYLQSIKKDQDVNLYINSPGGLVTQTLAIYDTIQFMGCSVATYCIGEAASGAAIILMAGSPGKRFILPNARIRNRTYVSPATHSTGATGGPASAPPYGARFRLRADYPLETLPSEGARVVARAMQRYGMFLADAGNIALTAQSDQFSDIKWDGLLNTRDLDAISVTDFEMIDAGERYTFTGDCVP